MKYKKTVFTFALSTCILLVVSSRIFDDYFKAGAMSCAVSITIIIFLCNVSLEKIIWDYFGEISYILYISHGMVIKLFILLGFHATNDLGVILLVCFMIMLGTTIFSTVFSKVYNALIKNISLH